MEIENLEPVTVGSLEVGSIFRTRLTNRTGIVDSRLGNEALIQFMDTQGFTRVHFECLVDAE